MTFVTGVGSWPTTSLPQALDEIGQILGYVPFLPELPQRNTDSRLIERTLGLLRGGAAGELIAADLYEWSQQCGILPEGLPATISLAGPWTLATASGLSSAAVANLADELMEGAHAFSAAAAALSGQPIVLQLDEPLLPTSAETDLAIVAKIVSYLSEATAPQASGVRLHSCATPAPLAALRRIGVPAHIDVAEIQQPLPQGWIAGIVPTAGDYDVATLAAHMKTVVAPNDLASCTIAPACGLGLSQDAGDRLRAAVEIAEILSHFDGETS
ncbi:MAG: hypothetical protein ACRDAX_07525 [Propionibacteriaceae bacterium]